MSHSSRLGLHLRSLSGLLVTLFPRAVDPRASYDVGMHGELMRRMAQRQYAYLERDQLHPFGVSRFDVRTEVEAGSFELTTKRLLRLVGAPYHEFELMMAATLDAGPTTVVAGRPGAALFRLRGFSSAVPIELARLRGTSSRQTTLAHVTTVRYPPLDFATTVRGIRVLTLGALIFQLAGREHPKRMARIVDDVWAKSPGTFRSLHRLLPELAERGRNGISVMRALLAERPIDSRPPDSGLERQFEAILNEHGEAVPARQRDLGGHEWLGRLDYADLEIAALYEVDSILHHTSLTDRIHDQERDADLLAAGWASVTRVFEEEIWYDRRAALAKVRETRRRRAAGETGFVIPDVSHSSRLG